MIGFTPVHPIVGVCRFLESFCLYMSMGLGRRGNWNAFNCGSIPDEMQLMIDEMLQRFPCILSLSLVFCLLFPYVSRKLQGYSSLYRTPWTPWVPVKPYGELKGVLITHKIPLAHNLAASVQQIGKETNAIVSLMILSKRVEDADQRGLRLIGTIVW